MNAAVIKEYENFLWVLGGGSGNATNSCNANFYKYTTHRQLTACSLQAMKKELSDVIFCKQAIEDVNDNLEMSHPL